VRNDAGVRKREGLESQAPYIVAGPEPGQIVVKENNLKFIVDPLHGQKTGFFSDQRDKRMVLQRYCRRLPSGATLLNCFSYTGAFAVYACAGRPDLHTTNVDQSERALNEAKLNFELNGLAADRNELVCADAFEWLEEQRQAGRQFDAVVLDPPAFAKSTKDKLRASKAYVRMNRLGITLTKPGGIMVTCSCSGPIGFAEFQDCLKEAAGQSGRRLQILETFQNGADHPLNVAVTEAGYLKVIYCRVL
jgi:23S rRNA (cytosine1962-C5)-methyltransferase